MDIVSGNPLKKPRRRSTAIDGSGSESVGGSGSGSAGTSTREAQAFSLARELACLNHLLDRTGLLLAIPRFGELIEEGDVFEVYNAEGKQIYRSWSFFRHCSYSVADLLVYDWNELFVRPTWIESHLRGLVPFFFRPSAGLLKYDVPEHLIYERYGDPSRVSLIQMKYALPLVCSKTNLPMAFITTGRIREVAKGFHQNVLSIL